jgi:RNA polymerase sigma-70 factor (ECF subfamily)
VDEGNQRAFQTAQLAAREHYGRLIAILAARTRDVSQAEDALAEAFAAALKEWPLRGIPQNPEAWLVAVAKRKHLDVARKLKTHYDASQHLLLLAEELDDMSAKSPAIPDERLGLMFACAHPAIEENVRSALVLQTVLGFTAEEIAAAFLVAPKTMGQRLARAKAKIKLAGIPFRVPDRGELADRLETVLEAIYACYAYGWNEADQLDNALTEEALWLGKLLVQLLPEEPECLGLLALMLFLQSRRKARRSVDAAFVPLSEQDTSHWNIGEISEAENWLRRAGSMGRMGRYQLEAAIQSVHAARRLSGATDWQALKLLYQALYQITGSHVVKLNGAYAIAECEGADVGLAAMPAVAEFPALEDFQPYHAVRAELLTRLGRLDEALGAYGRAIELEKDASVRRHLSEKVSTLRSALN